MSNEDNQDSDYLEENIGVFIDIDGVVLQGGKPFDWSKEAIHTLWNNKIPFMFVTNGTYSSKILVDSLISIFDLPFTNDHVVVAPSPCKALHDYHDKHVLVCCQDDSIDLITELGFSSFITVESLVEIFPELDYVDHKKRKILQKTPITLEMQKAQINFKPIEAIVLLGEPINWECSLQILLDILMTNGDPRTKFKFVPYPHLPIIACNKDLTFKGAASLPRFGHGAFLECLETLYQKVTKNELVYEKLMGKPYVVTYEFAVNQIQKLSKNGNYINKFFIIGDNPDVDIRGANTFKEHLQDLESKSSRRQSLARFDLCNPRQSKLSITVESILVCTGVYQKESDLLYHLRNLFNESESITSKDESGTNLKKIDSLATFSDTEKRELQRALSRKNSFISYFDNKLNIPDVTLENLKDAVDYIVKCLNENKFD